MDPYVHPTLSIISAKNGVNKRKKALREQYPDWTEKQISTTAEWSYYFSQWGTRFLQNIPYALLASLGTLSLLKDVIWFQPILASILSQWSEVAVHLFKIVTLGLLEWAGIRVPTWIVNYLTVGIGMTGIMAKMINDIRIIKKSSAFDDPMEHLTLTTGFLRFGIWIFYTPFIAPIWPALLLFPFVNMLSSSLSRDWGVSRSQLTIIQLKIFCMYTEPFIIAFIVWSVFANLP